MEAYEIASFYVMGTGGCVRLGFRSAGTKVHFGRNDYVVPIDMYYVGWEARPTEYSEYNESKYSTLEDARKAFEILKAEEYKRV